MALDKITTNIIEDDAITAAKIVAGAVEVDIRAGSVTGDKIGYLGDGTGNLSGTIANQQLHFGTAFTLTDNLTVNGDLTLGKVRDDGLGQSLTGSGRTLSGTGTLTMGSSVERADRVTSVSGMTGTLGTDVFPAGHVLQVQSTQTSAYAATGSSYIEAFTDVSLTTRGANKILITVNINGVVMFDAAGFIRFNLTDGSSSIQELTGHFAKATGSSDDPYASFGAQYLTGVLSANTTYTYNVEYKNNQGASSARLSGASQSLRTLTLMEIQQ